MKRLSGEHVMMSASQHKADVLNARPDVCFWV
jgi:hypothetical protein